MFTALIPGITSPDLHNTICEILARSISHKARENKTLNQIIFYARDLIATRVWKIVTNLALQGAA
ncbi:hypothetical protein ANRL2_03085 [Anaerolineae bacterium]|nr:hypothetical protein ANRL2_03085 [Anaerolineae bacterium]